jgi:Mlc titration factor MtfA (ptsG expression regulator)
MLSESGGMTKLGFMNEIQKKEFKAARKELKKQFRTQDKSWLGGFRFILPFKSCQANSTGIRSYGFINNLEFLTVSLDTFMQEPVKLCSTKPGQKIYDVYKAVFKLDPLNDLGSAAKAAK